MAFQLTKPALSKLNTSNVDLIGLVVAALFIYFCLLPDNGTLVLAWPWVFSWQILLISPWIWLIKQWWQAKSIIQLGYGLDYGVVALILSWLFSSLFSTFQHQSLWNNWMALSAIAALYAINTWCTLRNGRVLLVKAYCLLGCILSISSLGLWIHGTVLPELQRINTLNSQGLDLYYDFRTLELRNWAPFGHQNYLAGYLVLTLPLLLGQLLLDKNIYIKLFWGVGLTTGFIAMFTTSSRGGWLSLAISLLLGIIAILRSQKVPYVVRFISSIGLFLLLCVGVASNNRLRSFISSNPFSGGGETSYRVITNLIGWRIGIDHPFFGAGAGSAPLLFQKYRPSWAGLEAEWHYQLHSTPAHIWAEFGVLGVLIFCALLAWISFWGLKLWRSPKLSHSDRIICWALMSGLSGYGFMALTDYQLDMTAITGSLILYFTVFLAVLRTQPYTTNHKSTKSQRLRFYSLGICVFLVTMIVWISPILKAWQLSSQGFKALQNRDFNTFVSSLKQAHQLAPWDPYYLDQLGSQIGQVGLKVQDPEPRQAILLEAQSFLQKSTDASPYQEYSHSSLGWLQLQTDDPEAVQSFMRASQLVPGRRFVFHGLGLSLLQQKQNKLATEAFALEIVRNPMWMTSPLWKTEELSEIYPAVLHRVENIYHSLLETRSSSSLKRTIHSILGNLYWWQNDWPAAEQEWKVSNNQLGLDLLALAQNRPPKNSSLIMKAWLETEERQNLIKQALLTSSGETPSPRQVEVIQQGMDKATSFEMWIKENPPITTSWRGRTGFGIVSRHIDGPAPQDFFPAVENFAITAFFEDFFELGDLNQELDMKLDVLRLDLWSQVAELKK